MTDQPERPAVGYVRVSSADQVKHGISLELQRHRIRLYAESRGLALHSLIYADEGVSGRRSSNRRGLAGAIAWAVQRQAVLIVYSLSRFARSTRDCIDLSDQLSKSGADLISLSESIDTTSAHGRFFFTLLAALAQLESDQMSDRLKAAFAHKRLKREVCGGFLPWGQRAAPDGRHVEDAPEEIAVLDRIIALRTAGRSWADVARQLAEAAIVNRRGRPFSESNLVRLYKRHGPARGAPTGVYVAGLRERRLAGLAAGRESRRQIRAALLACPRGPRTPTALNKKRFRLVGQIDDFRGQRYDVHEVRRTSYDAFVMLGWPEGRRGRCKGAAALIPTRPLVDLLLAHVGRRERLILPIDHTAVSKLRRLLGIKQKVTAADWWAARRREFGQDVLDRYSHSGEATRTPTERQERRMGRRTFRRDWWREPDVQRILMTRTVSAAAKALGIAEGTVKRLRWQTRKQVIPS